MYKINCCFCNAKINFMESHDPRPIKSLYGDRCCANCNSNIVIPTRRKVWTEEKYLSTNEIDTLEETIQKADWFDEFIKCYKIDVKNTPEHSLNPIVEYCKQIEDLRLSDKHEIELFKTELQKLLKVIKN